MHSFNALDATTVHKVDIGGDLPLPLRVSASDGARTLLVLFHGAINRQKRTIPAFLDFRKGLGSSVHQMSISDPVLGLSNDLTNAWFSGCSHTPLQRLLPGFFDQMRRSLMLDRIVFMGSSSGGFAALFNSWHVAESVAVVTVPQTNIWNYSHMKRNIYLTSAWPGGLHSHPHPPNLDLRDLYSQPSSNSIVFIQSMLDQVHLHRQMLPFLASLPEAFTSRIVLKCSYWGRPGHSDVVPRREWDGWLRAVLDSPSISADDIATTYLTLGIETVPYALKPASIREAAQTQVVGASIQSRNTSNTQDQVWASLVAESVLGRGKKLDHASLRGPS